MWPVDIALIVTLAEKLTKRTTAGIAALNVQKRVIAVYPDQTAVVILFVDQESVVTSVIA